MVKVRKLGHIVLNVSDLRASHDFYVKALGMQVVAHLEEGKIMFLSLGEQHHDLALVQHATGDRPDPTQPGLVHIAWQVADFADLQDAYRELRDAGIEIDPIQHAITNSLYMRDPDGHQIEIYCDRWENGMEVLRESGPERRTLDIETGEAVGPKQELLKVRAD